MMSHPRKMAVALSFCLPLAGLTLSACQAPGSVDSAPLDPEDLGESAQALVDGACTGHLWIGRLPPGMNACPPPLSTSWTGTKLFPGAAAAPLSAYCQYEWTDIGTPTPLTLPKLPGSTEPATVWLDKDCHVVAPLGDIELMRAAVAPKQLEIFRRANRVPASFTLPVPSGSVRVAVVDSWPSLVDAGRSPHGFGMATLIRATACDGVSGPCSLDIRPYLALDIIGVGARDPIHGGSFGYQAAVARKIYQATRDWLGSDSPLVVNLSIGWDSPYNIDEEGQQSAAVTAVREAISHARCAGALVVAAAGNESGGLNPTTGLMYPAAWESMPLTCPSAFGEPHVLAVGAVDALDGPLPTARPGATPRLVADGYLVPAQGIMSGATVTVGPYSGTSVATAAVSGAAALLWLQNSSLTPLQVANQLHATGSPTALLPDVCPAGIPCSDVRRIDLCAALATPLTPCRPPPTKNPTWTQADAAALAALAADSFPSWSATAPVLGLPCTGDLYHDAAAPAPTPQQACPVEQLGNETRVPWLTPQPGNPICGACFLQLAPSSESILELGISERIVDPVHPATLSLLDDTGAVIDRYDLTDQTPDTGLTPGKVYQYNLPTIDSAVFKSAVVEWLRGEDGQSQSDIPLAKSP